MDTSQLKTFASSASRLIATSAQLARKQAELATLNNVTLPKLYHAIGKKIVGLEKLPPDLVPHREKIRELEAPRGTLSTEPCHRRVALSQRLDYHDLRVHPPATRIQHLFLAFALCFCSATGCMVRQSQPFDMIRWNNRNTAALKLVGEGKYREAESLIKQTMREIYWSSDDGPNGICYGHALGALACCYEAQGRFSEAELQVQKSIIILEGVFKSGHEVSFYGSMLADLQHLASLQLSQKRDNDAIGTIERAVALFVKHHSPPSGYEMDECACFYSSIGDLWARADRRKDAALCYEQAIAYWRQDAAPAWRHEEPITKLQQKLEKVQSAHGLQIPAATTGR